MFTWDWFPLFRKLFLCSYYIYCWLCINVAYVKQVMKVRLCCLCKIFSRYIMQNFVDVIWCIILWVWFNFRFGFWCVMILESFGLVVIFYTPNLNWTSQNEEKIYACHCGCCCCSRCISKFAFGCMFWSKTGW